MRISGKYVHFDLYGTPFMLCNQSSSSWGYPYPYDCSKDDLCSSGCGVFSIVHAATCMTGLHIPPEIIAHFSLLHGGRGDDGTDRPALLRAMEQHGLARKLGFFYQGEDLRNDTDALFSHLLENKGTALCNLRPGHIVTLIGAREMDGQKEVLAIDSASETDHPLIRDAITQVIPQSKVCKIKKNKNQLVYSYAETYGVYWVALETVRDFNLLHML